MSVLNFETFGAGHIPPYPKRVFDIKEGKSKIPTILSDDIEDVEYVKVSETSETSGKYQQKPSYDKDARSKEIFAYAEKKSKELDKGNDPIFCLFVITLIVVGADWADKNPESKFKTSEDRFEAFSAEMKKKEKEIHSISGERDPTFELISFLCASLGMKWATSNPPKYY